MADLEWSHYGNILSPSTWSGQTPQDGDNLIQRQGDSFTWASGEAVPGTYDLGSYNPRAPAYLWTQSSGMNINMSYLPQDGMGAAYKGERYASVQAAGFNNINLTETAGMSGNFNSFTMWNDWGANTVLTAHLTGINWLHIEGPGSLINESINASNSFITIESHMMGNGTMNFIGNDTINLNAAADPWQNVALSGYNDQIHLDQPQTFKGFVDIAKATDPIIAFKGDFNHASFAVGTLSLWGDHHGPVANIKMADNAPVGFSIFKTAQGAELTTSASAPAGAQGLLLHVA